MIVCRKFVVVMSIEVVLLSLLKRVMSFGIDVICMCSVISVLRMVLSVKLLVMILKLMIE